MIYITDKMNRNLAEIFNIDYRPLSHNEPADIIPTTNIQPTPNTTKNWQITRPNGDIIMVDNLSQFCRDENLKLSKMLSVGKGRKPQYKGFLVSIIGETKPTKPKPIRKYNGVAHLSTMGHYVITAPDGTVHNVTGLCAFCKTHGLHAGTMSWVAKGVYNHHKGWQCKKVLA